MTQRKIAVLTGTRADYDLLYWTMKKIVQDPLLNLQLIVTGTHLEDAYGKSIDLIAKDGFSIDAQINCQIGKSEPLEIARSFSIVVDEVAKHLFRLQPDVLIVLGDRYEALAAASAALLMHVPVAHIHGGEVTEGAIDDQMRHAITKISQWHFVAAEEYRRRVIQMGEDPGHVWNVGALGVETIQNTPHLSKEELEQKLGFKLRAKNILLTVHPETATELSIEQAIESVAKALSTLPDLGVIMTATNSDLGGPQINKILKNYSALHSNTVYIPNLGRLLYVNVLRYVDGVVGNSSSGILETPSVPIGSVNIGDRQKGRLRSPSVIDCGWETLKIVEAINLCTDVGFRQKLNAKDAVFGVGNASEKIVEVLKNLPIGWSGRKSFVDLPKVRHS